MARQAVAEAPVKTGTSYWALKYRTLCFLFLSLYSLRFRGLGFFILLRGTLLLASKLCFFSFFFFGGGGGAVPEMNHYEIQVCSP